MSLSEVRHSDSGGTRDSGTDLERLTSQLLKMRNIKISIITPTFNSSTYIKETIYSVISQSYTDWELLIIDDCSSDDTVEIVESFTLSDERIRLIKNQQNKGASFSRNVGIAKSHGDYLAFLDSDDLWEKDKLQTQITFMRDHKIAFCFTGYLIVDSSGKSSGKTVDSSQKGSFSYNDMLAKKATLGCSTVMLKKSSFKGLLQMPDLRTGQDYAFWLKILRCTNQNAYILPLVLTQYRITPNSISRNKFNKAKRQWFIYNKIENLGSLRAAYYFCFYVVRAIFRTP
jgi:teichuronic acid biosynthesis glycosyltransferase TuaG